VERDERRSFNPTSWPELFSRWATVSVYFSLTVSKFEILEMTAQSLLKPGVFGPPPILLREIFVLIEAAVRFALQQYELPVAHLVFLMMNSREQFF
jgi:hypothetical protein